MQLARHRWIVLACFLSWALGPLAGIGLAAHELEHHASGSMEHSHAAEAAGAVLHGHFHEEGEDGHGHDVAPPSSTPTRLGQKSQLPPLAVMPAGASSWSDGVSGLCGPPPEPRGLGPPPPFALCVLRF